MSIFYIYNIKSKFFQPFFILSTICLTSSFLGTRIELDVFNKLKYLSLVLSNWLNAIVRSSLVMSQWSYKNRPMSSRPDAPSQSYKELSPLSNHMKRGTLGEERSCCWYPKKVPLKVASLITEDPKCCWKWSDVTFTLSSRVYTNQLLVCRLWMYFF